MIKKIINIGVLLIMSICIVNGCVDYKTKNNITKNNILCENAIIYDKAKEWMYIEYIKENVTRSIYYDGQFYFEDESYPRSITHIIADNEAFINAFKEFPLSIDFNIEMIVVYFFSGNAIYTDNGKKLFSYQIQESYLENGVFTIGIKEKCLLSNSTGEPIPVGLPPTHECLVIKTNKIAVDSVYIKRV